MFLTFYLSDGSFSLRKLNTCVCRKPKESFFFSTCESFMRIHVLKYRRWYCEYNVSGVDRGLKICVHIFRESRQMVHPFILCVFVSLSVEKLLLNRYAKRHCDVAQCFVISCFVKKGPTTQ